MQEGLIHLEYKFKTRRFRRHYPKGLFFQHDEYVYYSWSYSHERCEEEAFTKKSQSWDEVLETRSDHHMTIFKSGLECFEN